MSDIAIKCDGLSKQYRIGEQERYKALRDVIADAAASPFRRLRAALDRGSQIADGSENAGNGYGSLVAPAGRRASVAGEEIRNSKSEIRNSFWALDDVSFEVKRGEVVGIIGRNGAGKSTLLKILSRITKPTKGHATINGRVGSLLEVGTGFHPELTGRENIYLNAAILGMRKAEVAKKFDEIVAFAEVEKFIDTPVKRYSSGMYVRLAFAVAAHMETEVLLVDEVLAVGDAQFQKKCLGKVGEVSKAGRTVLLVSHNMGSIKALCKSVLWLQSGKVKELGSCSTVIHGYLNALEHETASSSPAIQHLKGDGRILIEHVVLVDSQSERKNDFLISEPFEVRLHYIVRNPVQATFWMLICSNEGEVLVSSFQKDVDAAVELNTAGIATVKIESINLLPGSYTISAGIFSSANDIVDWTENIAQFEVLPHFADGRPFDHRYGLISQEFAWQIVQNSKSKLSGLLN